MYCQNLRESSHLKPQCSVHTAYKSMPCALAILDGGLSLAVKHSEIIQFTVLHNNGLCIKERDEDMQIFLHCDTQTVNIQIIMVMVD